MSELTELKRTPYTDCHVDLGAKMVPFAGYYMPVQFTGIIEEHRAVRNNVGLFDLSHMGEFEVTGPKALEFFQMVTTNDVSELDINQIQYTCMTYEDGGIVDDLLLYRFEDRYLMVVNAANIDKDFEWLSRHLIDGVTLVNRSDEISLLAIQGPNSQKVMKKLTSYALDDLKYYHSIETEVAGKRIMFSRTGYTGEDGFELYIPFEDGPHFWKAVNEAGKSFNMIPIGLGARDTLRLEMKMALYGNDIDRTTNPIEAGLSWIVKLEKGDFIGKDAIERVKQEKPSRKLVCMVLQGKAFPRKGYDIYKEGDNVGRVTSGTVSPSLGEPIAMGYVARKYSKSGNIVDIDIRGKRFPAEIIKPPFYKKDQ